MYLYNKLIFVALLIDNVSQRIVQHVAKISASRHQKGDTAGSDCKVPC